MCKWEQRFEALCGGLSACPKAAILQVYLQVRMQKQRKEEWTNLGMSDSWLFKHQNRHKGWYAPVWKGVLTLWSRKALHNFMVEDIIQGCRNLEGKTFSQLLDNEAEEMLDTVSVACGINMEYSVQTL